MVRRLSAKHRRELLKWLLVLVVLGLVSFYNWVKKERSDRESTHHIPPENVSRAKVEANKQLSQNDRPPKVNPKNYTAQAERTEVTTEFLCQDITTIRYLEEPLPASSLGERIFHTGFTLSYRVEWLQSEWVAYALERSELEKRTSRSDSFTADPKISGASATYHDYKGSGYDRGHLAPAGDMSWSVDAMEESFYFSNISPQIPEFNQGIWNRLENRVRKLAERYGTVYIVTGPLFHGEPLEYVGESNIPVATHFFKALLVKQKEKWYGIGYALPHQTGLRHFRDYSITVDSLQKLTGLDFFPLLPDSVEVEVERQIVDKIWR